MRFDFWLIFYWFFSCLEKLVALSHISEFQNLFVKAFTHTHTLHELSKLFSLLCFQGKFCLSNACISTLCLCNLTNLSELDTCVCCSTCEGTNLVVFLSHFREMFSFLTGSLVFRTVVWYLLLCFPCPVVTFRGSNCRVVFPLLCFTLCHFVKKNGE
jgi:hypothetical protein